MKQIVLITDGCSNVGIDPVVAATHARAENITVHVVGVIDQGEFGVRGKQEVAEIAEAGGGMHRIVPMQQLSGTIQMMTRQTVTATVQLAVERKLKQVFAINNIDELSPVRRAKAAEVVDHVSETAPLQVALLVDTSASMRPKLQQVERSIQDLSLSLQARQGRSEAAVFHFPGISRPLPEVHVALDWTSEVGAIGQLFRKLNMRGATPTGPALMRVIEHFEKGRFNESDEADRQLSIKHWQDEAGLYHEL